MRRGFTLLEVVLVLVIMVIAAALTVPVITTMLDDAHMSAGADMIRARLADTRAKALDTGKPWKLGYMPGGKIFQMAAADSDQWTGSETDVKEMPEYTRGEMPKDVVLAANRDDIASAQGGSSGSGGWQTLAVYLGDGSARDDGVVYIGKPGLVPLRVRVRGLTGATTLDVPALVKDNP